MAAGIYTAALESMKADPIFLLPTGAQMLVTIQLLSQRELTDIVRHISSHKNIHCSINPSTLDNHVYFQLEQFVTQALGQLQDKQTDEVEFPSVCQTDDTLQGIYYVGGSIACRLKRNPTWDGEDREQINLWSLQSSESEVPSAWTDLVSRGGLCDISADLFEILKLMDSIATTALQSISGDCNLTVNVMESVLSHPQIHSLVTGISVELLHSVAKMFTKVRCKAFVQGRVAYMSTSLRQNLMGSHGSS